MRSKTPEPGLVPFPRRHPGRLGASAPWVLAASVLAVLQLACGGAPATPEQATGPTRPPLPELPGLVPEGADRVVVASPAALWSAPAARQVIRAVVADETLDAFANRTGVDPRELEELVVAEYRVGLLVLARGSFVADDVVHLAGERMSTVEVISERPFVRRAGFLGARHVDLAALDRHTLVLGRDLGSVMAALLARVQSGRWAGRAPALAERPNDALRADHADAPAALYVPQPLSLPEGYGTSTLLAGEEALAVTATPEGPGDLRIVVDLRGRFPEGAVANFRRLVTSVAETDLGAALGLAEGLPSLRVETGSGSVRLSLLLPSATLARGLRMLFAAGLQELLEVRGGGGRAP